MAEPTTANCIAAKLLRQQEERMSRLPRRASASADAMVKGIFPETPRVSNP
jgi:hypothetical protein